MSAEQPDPKTFFESPDAIAITVDADALFGFLPRAHELPADQAALVTRAHGDRIAYAPGSEVERGSAEAVLLVRTTPNTITFDALTVTSLDRYQCPASAKIRVSVVPESSELTSFQRSLLGGHGAVGLAALHDYIEPHVIRALSAVADGRGVEVLIDPANGEAFSTEVADALKRATFAAGLRIDGSIDVRFDSPVYRQVRASRAAAERREAEFDAQQRIAKAVETAQRERAKHLADLLEQLSRNADRSPNHDLADLLGTFPETERGELYAALFGADDTRAVTRWIVAGSGRELLFFAPDLLATPARTVHIPDTIGPVRSVRFHADADGRSRLIVGASRGLHDFAVDGDAQFATHTIDSDEDVRGGVNSAAIAGDNLFASHSELGVLYWNRGDDAPARAILADRTRGASAVRCSRFFNGRVYFSIDEQILSVPADAPNSEPEVFTGNHALITALCPTIAGLYAGNADGQILHWPEGQSDEPELLHSGRQRSAESVAVLDFGGLSRLFYTDTSVAVFARVLGDTFTCRYEAAGQTLRRVEVAPDLIVATNEIRDRLIFWRPSRPDTPLAVVAVSPLTGHSIQDVCLIPA